MTKTLRLGTLALLLVSGAASAQTQPTRVPPASPTDFQKALRNAQPGDVLLTSFAKLDEQAPPLKLTITPSPDAATLVFSDRPEYFRSGDGIASQNTVQPGRIRVYTYHVPMPLDGKPRRMITRVENLGDAEATLTFAAHSEPPMGGDYQAVAKRAMLDLLNGSGAGDVLKIPPHGHEIADRVEAVEKPDLLVHGLFEFTTDQPLRITVAQVTATNDLDADVRTLETLPKLSLIQGKQTDKSGRGVFRTADLDVALASNATYDTAAGPAQVIVADGKSDPWQVGVDGISGEQTTDKGNYGVVYHMKLKWKSTDGRALAVLLASARFDSIWCNAVTAAVRINDGRRVGGVLGLPRDKTSFHELPEACVIQTFDAPANGAEATIELTYTPPGSCCLPTPILLVPIDR